MGRSLRSIIHECPTCQILGVFPEPNDGGFRLGVVHYTSQLDHHIFTDGHSGTRVDAGNLNLGRWD